MGLTDHCGATRGLTDNCVSTRSLTDHCGATRGITGHCGETMGLTRVIGILNKLKHIFPHNILRTIYNSLIHPHLIYGLYLWGFSLKRLTILQKKAVRILLLRLYISHSTPLFKNLKILKIEDQYLIQLYKLYYKNTNNLLPQYFNSFTPYYNNEDIAII